MPGRAASPRRGPAEESHTLLSERALNFGRKKVPLAADKQSFAVDGREAVFADDLADAQAFVAGSLPEQNFVCGAWAVSLPSQVG